MTNYKTVMNSTTSTKKYWDQLIIKGNMAYRYNSETAILEWLTAEDYDVVDGKLVIIKTPWTQVSSIGLSNESAKDLGTWIDSWEYEIEQEMKYLI